MNRDQIRNRKNPAIRCWNTMNIDLTELSICHDPAVEFDKSFLNLYRIAMSGGPKRKPLHHSELIEDNDALKIQDRRMSGSVRPKKYNLHHYTPVWP